MAKPYLRKDTETWYVLHGREKIRVGKSERAARHLVDKINTDVAEGRVGIHKARDKNIEAFFNEIIDYKKNIRSLRPKSLSRYQAIIKNFLTFLSLKYPTVTKLSQLDRNIFEKYIHYRKTIPTSKNGLPITKEKLKQFEKTGNLIHGAKDKTIKVELQFLKSALNLAVKNKDEKNRYLLENPLDYIEPVTIRDETSKRPLTEEETKKFLSYLKQHDNELFEIFFTFIYTGLRDGELRHLEWKDIDFNNRMITLKEKVVLNESGGQEVWTPKTKKGKREIPIHAELFKILQNRKKNHKGGPDYVFPDPKGGILKRKLRTNLIKTMKAIGIKDFTRVHDLRRTFISFMAMAGVPRETTMDMVGHVDEKTYNLYRESTRKHKIESINKLNFGFKISE